MKRLIQKVSSLAISENIMIKPYPDLTPRKMRTTRKDKKRPLSPSNLANLDLDLKSNNNNFFGVKSFFRGTNSAIKDDADYFSNVPMTLARSHSRDAVKVENLD